MQEYQKIQQEIKQIKAKNALLTLSHPYSMAWAGCGFLSFGAVTSNFYLQAVGAFVVLGAFVNLTNLRGLLAQKESNDEVYFEKAIRLHQLSQMKIQYLLSNLRYERDKQVRRQVISSVLFLKKHDSLRNMDLKELILLNGRKRRGLAIGLKDLRSKVSQISCRRYKEQRENILSYY